ncbi:unnamed protein product [Prunus armeniaca]
MEAERRKALYNKTVAQAYNRTVKPQAFKQGDLVLKVVEHVRRQMSGPSKFAPQWEGPFAVKELLYHHSSMGFEKKMNEYFEKKIVSGSLPFFVP